MKKFIFDVDGTLTPSRGRIDPQFEAWFWGFIQREKVWLVTGSDYPKTVEQLGKDICESVVTCYNCSGNDTWFKGKRVNASSWKLPDNVRQWLEDELVRSPFPLRTGNHIEERLGCINFSVVGRKANQKERAQYIKYDIENGERREIANSFNYIFGPSLGLHATIGGETGLDIHPIGKDKSQILSDFNLNDNIFFFGDKMELGGNDWPLANALEKYPNGHAIQVKDWQHTWDLLKEF
jgi:phosphomannomutase